MTTTQTWALRLAAILWIVWGLVHVLAGVMTLTLDTAEAVAGIADAVDAELLADLSYHPAASAILHQHGWNLAWIGATTLVSGVGVWRANMRAIRLAALVGGMADLGYLLFLDLPGHVNSVPGTLMTLVSGTAILLSGWVWFAQRSTPKARP